MQQRAIKKQENILIQHLLALIPDSDNFEIPQIVTDLDDSGMQSIRLTSNRQAAYSHNLIQAKYLDEDNILVLITLTKSNTNELFELEFRKVYADNLINYPEPGKIKCPMPGQNLFLNGKI